MSRGLSAVMGALLRSEIGPYRVIRPLGEGGMGVVYLAKHQDSDARVALKVVRLPDANVLASLRREIFALRSIEHPSVVRIVDDGVVEGHPWYAMEFLGGSTLSDYIDSLHEPHAPSRTLHAAPTLLAMSTAEQSRADTLAPPPDSAPVSSGWSTRVKQLDETLGMMRELCTPLAYVHGAGLVHRDLKPQNVILSDTGTPVLVDFGLALRFTAAEPGRDVLDFAAGSHGTPPYMAPEQIRGDVVDARADLYALGCMLYECLTGNVPFDGSPMSVLRRHLDEVPVPPSRLVDGISEPLDTLVLRLLAKRPGDRLGFAVDVAAALAELGGRIVALPGAPKPRSYLYRPSLSGRGSVLRRLEAALPRSRSETGPHDRPGPSLVLIGGQSGVGKTRLAMELATRAARRSLHVVAAQCLEVKSAPLYPIRPLLLSIADRCQSLGAAETEHIVADDGPVLATCEPSFSQLPGQGHLAPPPPLPAEAARFRLMEALAATLARFCERRPTLFVLDDLQWADELTLVLLDHIGGRLDARLAGKLVVLGTYRSEEQTTALGELAAAEQVFNLVLGPLGRDAVSQMVADMLALAEPPEALIDFLCTESEGNPFFIAEYLRVAIDEGVIQRVASGEWTVGSEGQSLKLLRSKLPLPSELRSLVRRRIARLDPDGRALAEMAAVLGSDVDADVLISAAPIDAGRGRVAIEQLRARHVLEEADRGGLRFAHDKLREIIYADIPAATRPELHGAAARAIEEHTDDVAVEYARLAHHHEHADQVPEALGYLDQAGAQALANSAWSDAREYYQHALALADSRDVEVDQLTRACWQRRLGVACYSMGELGEARKQLTHCLDGLGVRRLPRVLAQREKVAAALTSLSAFAGQLRQLTGFAPPASENPMERVRYREAALAAERLSQVYYFESELDLSFGAALECARHAERLGPSPELARAYATLATALSYVPLPAVTNRYGARAEAIAREVADPHARAWVGFMRGLTSLRAGLHGESRRFLLEALEVAKRSGDVRHAQEIEMLLAQVASMAGQRRAALEHAERILEGAIASRNGQAELWARGAIAKNLTDLGRAEEALESYAENAPLARRTDDASTRMAECYAANAHLMLGRLDEATAVVDELLATARRPTTWHATLGWVAACETYLACLTRNPADREAYTKAKRACVVLYRASRIFRSFRPLALVYRGLLRERRGWMGGASKKARRDWRHAVNIADALDLPAEAARAHYELARHLPASDDRRSHHHTQAADRFTQIEASYWLAQLARLR